LISINVKESDIVKSAEINIYPGLNIFVGYNAAFKSATARTAAYCKDDGEASKFRPNLLDLGVDVETKDQGKICSLYRAIVEDTRISLRKLLLKRDTIIKIHENLKQLENSDEPLVSSLVPKIKNDVSDLLDGLIAKELKDLADMKKRVPSSIISTFYKIYSDVYDDLLNRLKQLYPDIDPTAITPLEVEELDVEEDRWTIRFRDRRFNRVLTYNTLSTSIIIPILFEYTIAFLSLPRDKMLIIEEPEESMTPLQQVFYIKFLEAAVEESNKRWETYVIITTHSPYMALPVSAKKYFFGFSKSERKIVIEAEKPLKAFTLADFLMLG